MQNFGTMIRRRAGLCASQCDDARMSRAQTLVLALLTLHVLLGVLCVIIARGEHKAPALRWWGWGLLTYSAGLAITLPGVLPRVAGLTLGNALITVAPVVCAHAMLSHTRFRLSRLWVGAALATSIGIIAVNNVGGWILAPINVVTPTPLAVILYLIAGVVLVRGGPAEAKSAATFLGVICILAALSWIARVATIFLYLQGTSDIQRADIVISLFAIIQMVTGVGATLALMWIDVRLMQAELSRIAHTDALTGLPNRRAIMMRFDAELARALRQKQPFGFAIFDIDHFKKVNDVHGHAAGDRVLRAAANVFDTTKRAEDVLGRLGGEEFLMLLPAQTREASRDATERLRERLRSTSIEHDHGSLHVTVSGGLAVYPEDGDDWDELFAAADRRLYDAKKGGRDRILA